MDRATDWWHHSAGLSVTRSRGWLRLPSRWDHWLVLTVCVSCLVACVMCLVSYTRCCNRSMVCFHVAEGGGRVKEWKCFGRILISTLHILCSAQLCCAHIRFRFVSFSSWFHYLILLLHHHHHCHSNIIVTCFSVLLLEELEDIASALCSTPQGGPARGWTVDCMSRIGLTCGSTIEYLMGFTDKWGSKSSERRAHILSSTSYCLMGWMKIAMRYYFLRC